MYHTEKNMTEVITSNQNWCCCLHIVLFISSTKYLRVCLFCLRPISSEMRCHTIAKFCRRVQTMCKNIYWVLCLKGSSLPKNDIFLTKYPHVGQQSQR